MGYPSGSYTRVRPSFADRQRWMITVLEFAYLFKPTLVFFPIVRSFWLVRERHSRKLVFVVGVPHVLCIFEDRVEKLHPLGSEEANLGDKTLKT